MKRTGAAGMACCALVCAGLFSCASATQNERTNLTDQTQEQVADRARPEVFSEDELSVLARKGDVRAMTRLAAYYQSGRSALSENEAVKRAVYWWERAAENGESMALVNLGLLSAHTEVPGAGDLFGDIPLDYKKAAAYFARASEEGNMKAPRQLGLLYLDGADGIPKDEEKAASLFRLAGERGDSTGTLCYADSLLAGRGVGQDVPRALALYQKLIDTDAHDAGAAAYRLGCIYEEGTYVAKDSGRAADCYRLAADKGSGEAAFALANPAGRGGIQNVTTIAESFGDGEKVSAVIIQYGKAINAAALSPDSFTVAGRTIESARTNSRAAKTDVSVPGNYVVLNLKYENKWDATGGRLPSRPRNGGAGNGQSGSTQAANGPRFGDDGVPVDVGATVTQTGGVRAADGTVYAATNTALTSTGARELVLEEFSRQSFTDSETGITLPYFVYLPRGYSTAQKYPLVFFIPDASADTSIDTATLTQGNGATIWATPEEQAKHPAIVVAVQYPYAVVREYGALTTDDNVWTPGLTAVDNLLRHVVANYAVDEGRIYGTGQSQGCMSNIALSDRHPELFAAQFLVAGQWNVEEMAAMKDKKLWIVVCEGDGKAFPGMAAAADLWESLGAKVARGDEMWNPGADREEQAANVRAMLAKDAPINFNVFEGGSHMYTWSIAYNIEGIRDWLFAQAQGKASAKPGAAGGTGWQSGDAMAPATELFTTSAAKVYENLAYASRSASQVCDIYLPQGTAPFPVIALVHGGGFAFQNQRMKIIEPVAQAAVSRGYAVVSIDYRKSGEARFPGALADVKAAVRFIRAHAGDYGLDADRMAVWGESAGAYLAAMTALTPSAAKLDGDVDDNAVYSSAVNAFVDFYGPVEFYTMDDEFAALGRSGTTYSEEASFESRYLGQAVGKDRTTTYQTYWESYRSALPSASLKAWIQAGTGDKAVPYTQSKNLAERLAPLIGSGNVRYSTIAGANHMDGAFYTEANLAAVLDFLDGAL